MVEELLRVLWISYLGSGEASWESLTVEGPVLNRISVFAAISFVLLSKNRYIYKMGVPFLLRFQPWVPC